MGIDNFYFKKLKKIIDQEFKFKKNLKALCLGYPDLLVAKDVLINELGLDYVNNLPIDSLADDIKRWHKKPSDFEVYDSLYILKNFGFEITIFDAVKHRNIETIVNLNEQLNNNFDENFDLVIDTGTLEHCFNVGTAFKNICQTVKKDGIFVTSAPVTKLDHGYWNFGTIVYKDGFEKNGFKILEQSYFKGEDEVFNPTRKNVPNLTVAFCIAKRIEIKEWVWPIQGKYI